MSDRLKKAQDLCDLSRKLLDQGLVARTWGNLSLRLSQESFLITPSGISYVNMNLQDIVQVQIRNGQWQGDRKPSSEMELHRSVYKALPKLGLIIHSHQPAASVLAAARKSLQVQNPKARDFLGDEVPCVSYALTGSPRLSKGVEDFLKIQSYQALILAGHGALILGQEEERTLERAQWLEKEATAFIEREASSKSFGEVESAPDRREYFVRKNRFRGDR